MTGLLRRLGYRASLRLLSERRFLAYTDDSRNGAQVVSGGWGAEYPSPSTFIAKMSCGGFIPGSKSNFNVSGFCDPTIDQRIARAQSLQTTDPTKAAALWARLDRELTDGRLMRRQKRLERRDGRHRLPHFGHRGEHARIVLAHARDRGR